MAITIVIPVGMEMWMIKFPFFMIREDPVIVWRPRFMYLHIHKWISGTGVGVFLITNPKCHIFVSVDSEKRRQIYSL